MKQRNAASNSSAEFVIINILSPEYKIKFYVPLPPNAKEQKNDASVLLSIQKDDKHHLYLCKFKTSSVLADRFLLLFFLKNIYNKHFLC